MHEMEHLLILCMIRRCQEFAPQYPTRSMNQIQDAVLSFTNSDTIPFLNKTYFKYSFVKGNYPYENIYVYITLT